MDLRSFRDSHKGAGGGSKPPTEEDIRSAAEHYADKSDEELLAEILRTARQGKKDGTINDESIRSFVANISPLLSEEQRARLESVIRLIGGN